jgi:CO/xanthine dehydrogenase FAD-binding subunit
MKKWYGIPQMEEDGKVSIHVGNDTGKFSELVLALDEIEALQWRLKQATQLLKNGKISKQRA